MVAGMELSVVIVNWNTRDQLEECLRSVFTTIQDLEFEVLVVDNASSDGSPRMVRGKFPQVRLFESQENLGFARGNNLALPEANGEYVLLLNPDAMLQTGAVPRLCAYLQACPNVGAVGAQLVNPDGSLQESWGRFPSLWTELPVLNRLLRSEPRILPCALAGQELARTVDWLSGACLLIRRQALEATGLLDEDYWLYTEEADWCFRARKVGWEIGLLPGVQVVHIRLASSRQRYVETMLHFHRSRLLFILKHRGWLQASLTKLVLCAKAAVWLALPQISPLCRSYPDLDPSESRQAHRQLARQMLLPLDSALEAPVG